MTLRYQRFRLLFVAALLLVLPTGFAGQSWGERAATPGEARSVEAMATPAAGLPLWQRLLSGQDSVRVAEMEEQITELREQAKYAEAVPLAEEVLEIRRQVQGEDHWEVAEGVLSIQMLKHIAELPPGAQEELQAADRSGPEWVAPWLQGRYGEAASVLRRILRVYRRHLGDEYRPVATTMNFLAGRLRELGDYASAEALYRESLAIRRELWGDLHPDLAYTVGNLGSILGNTGDYAGAEVLCRQEVAMWCAVFGRQSSHAARAIQTLGELLAAKGDNLGAERCHREAVAILRKLPGYELTIAHGLGQLGDLLLERGDHAGAEQLHREAVAICSKSVGSEHPLMAASRWGLAKVLHAEGDYAGAERLYREAHAVQCRMLGDEHPAVVETRGSLAKLLQDKGDYAAAESVWVDAAESFEAARRRASLEGLRRVHFSCKVSPLAPLAACLARNGKRVPAWVRLEANMARGVLDELSARLSRPLEPEERDREEGLLGQVAKLDERISASLSVDDSTGEAAAGADTLRWRRNSLLAELARFEADMAAKYGVAAGEVYELGRIQEVLPLDVALLAWADVKGDSHAVDPNGEHWACVVTHLGEPVWVKLPDSGDGGTWTEADNELPNRVREVLGEGATGVEEEASPELLQRLYSQRLAAVEPHLAGVRRLIILPAGWMAGIPVEALTDKYAISYAPSATMYAWLKEGRRSRLRQDYSAGVAPATKAKGYVGQAQVEGPRSKDEPQTPSVPGEAGERIPLLALGDPVFGEPVESDTTLPEPPDHGVMLAMVMDGSNAARGGVQSGDVLLSYGDDALGSADELGPAIQRAAEGTEDSSRSIPVRVWRDGETLDVAVAPGELGVSPSSQSAREAVRARRRLDSVLEQTRGETFEPLPGSRLEVEAIANLFADGAGETAPTLLLGPEASERRLDELATSGELAQYRHIHLATHALMDDEVAMRSALILSQETGDALERVLEGQEVYDSRLTAEQIVRTWKLNADLVTLSGCETALGKASGGEGFLGFSQALFVAGARSLVLSLWEVEDTPTMLLMRRFYENLLGKFDEPRLVSGQTYRPGAPLPKVDALREAKTWLRELTWDELMELEAAGDPAAPGPEAEKMVTAGGSDRLYEHPHYWAAFILMGNPD
jgi:CHAT domain-containing protein/tetratricopeptide (TPR) repeat protein